MINRMKDRCKLICGSDDADCFVMSKNQLNCIADLVINKTTAISMLLGYHLSPGEKNNEDEMVRAAFASTNELSNWIKYLQMVGDMRELHSLVLDSDRNEKRSEIRYPLPDAHAHRVGIAMAEAEGQGFLKLINYSQSGVRFVSPVALEEGGELQFHIVSKGGNWADPVSFKAEVRNCWGSGGNFQVGARVGEISGKDAFNFFLNIHSLILGVGIRDNM